MSDKPEVSAAEIRRLVEVIRNPENKFAVKVEAGKKLARLMRTNALAIADALDENAALRIENRVLKNRLIALESQND